MTSDILFTPDGKRYEKGDFRAAADPAAHFSFPAGHGRPEHVQPFVLTSQELRSMT